MAKFIYRMQNILDIKYKMEAQAKSHYALMQTKFNEEQYKLEKMFASKRALEDEYRRIARGPLDVRKIAESKRAIEFKREEIKKQLIEVRVAQKNLDAARARLNDVMKDRKTHEKLRENAFDEFLQELSAEEKKEIDELVSYKYSLTDE
ncbi:MAG: flagellar export protein FliJ [Butyrivibrio sp.]